MKFYCPICKVDTYEEAPTNHFRFTHHISSDDIINHLFAGLAVLDDRVSNLCELLEIKEK